MTTLADRLTGYLKNDDGTQTAVPGTPCFDCCRDAFMAGAHGVLVELFTEAASGQDSFDRAKRMWLELIAYYDKTRGAALQDLANMPPVGRA